jgi:hypothetical protein
MKIVLNRISRSELKEMAERMFGDLVKAVVDVEKRIMVVDAELHADQESFLLEQGSKQENLWGINLYPEAGADDFIEFDSMINVRPSQGNRSRTIDDPTLRKLILDIVHDLVES